MIQTIQKSKKGNDIYIYRNFLIWFASLHTKSDKFYDGQYGFRLLIPKSGDFKEKSDKLIAYHARKEIPGKNYRWFIRDGDDQLGIDDEPVDEPKEIYFNHWIYKAKNLYQPTLRDVNGQVIETDNSNVFHTFGIYADIWVRSIFYKSKMGKQYIAGLQPLCLQKIKNAEEYKGYKTPSFDEEVSNYAESDEEDIPF